MFNFLAQEPQEKTQTLANTPTHTHTHTNCTYKFQGRIFNIHIIETSIGQTV